jgi:hypothetical protein
MDGDRAVRRPRPSGLAAHRDDAHPVAGDHHARQRQRRRDGRGVLPRRGCEPLGGRDRERRGRHQPDRPDQAARGRDIQLPESMEWSSGTTTAPCEALRGRPVDEHPMESLRAAFQALIYSFTDEVTEARAAGVRAGRGPARAVPGVGRAGADVARPAFRWPRSEPRWTSGWPALASSFRSS